MSSVFDFLGSTTDRTAVSVAELAKGTGVVVDGIRRGMFYELDGLRILTEIRLRKWMREHGGSYLPECGTTPREVMVFIMNAITEAAEEQGIPLTEISVESIIELLQEYIV